MSLTLSKTRPADRKPNPYRTRWVEVEGVSIEVVSDSLDGLWMVALDLDLIHTLDRRSMHTGVNGLDWINGPHYWSAIAFTLAEAREKIEALIASPEWPAIRDAYLALIEEAKA